VAPSEFAPTPGEGDGEELGEEPLPESGPDELPPHPAISPTATAATITTTVFNLDFIISPLSVVAPVWTQKNQGLCID